jgi:hypothetical protein
LHVHSYDEFQDEWDTNLMPMIGTYAELISSCTHPVCSRDVASINPTWTQGEH